VDRGGSPAPRSPELFYPRIDRAIEPRGLTLTCSLLCRRQISLFGNGATRNRMIAVASPLDNLAEAASGCASVETSPSGSGPGSPVPGLIDGGGGDDAGPDSEGPALKKVRLSTDDTLTGAAMVLRAEQEALSPSPAASSIQITVAPGKTTPPPPGADVTANNAAVAMGAMSTLRHERNESILHRSKSGGGGAAGVGTPEENPALATWRREMAAHLDAQLQQAIDWHASAKRSLVTAPGPQGMYNMMPGMPGMPGMGGMAPQGPWGQFPMGPQFAPGPYGYPQPYMAPNGMPQGEMPRPVRPTAAASAAQADRAPASVAAERKPAAKKRKSKSGSRHPKVVVDPKNKSQYPRPPDSYAQLAANAINATPDKKAKVTQIYEWVEKTHPFYKHQGAPWWKNCIRHNLSMKKCFLRHPNAGGVGVHLWSVIPGREDLLTPSRRVSYHRNPVKVTEPKVDEEQKDSTPAGKSQASHAFLSQLLQAAAHDQGDSEEPPAYSEEAPAAYSEEAPALRA